MRFERSASAGIADDLWLAMEGDIGFAITLERSWFTASYMNRETGEKGKLGDYLSFDDAAQACFRTNQKLKPTLNPTASESE